MGTDSKVGTLLGTRLKTKAAGTGIAVIRDCAGLNLTLTLTFHLDLQSQMICGHLDLDIHRNVSPEDIALLLRPIHMLRSRSEFIQLKSL